MKEWLKTQHVPGPVLDTPSAASTDYLDLPEATSAPIDPPLGNAQELEDAAADIVASVKGLSSGPSEATVSDLVESSTPIGTPPRSESPSVEETDLEGSIDLEVTPMRAWMRTSMKIILTPGRQVIKCQAHHTRRVKTVLVGTSR